MKSVREAAAEFFCTLPCNPRNAKKTLQRLNFTVAEAAEIIACFTHKNPNGKLMVSHATIDSLERVMCSSIEMTAKIKKETSWNQDLHIKKSQH